MAVSPVRIDGRAGDWYGLGPISVRPDCQGRGIGSLLMAQALDALRLLRAGGCVLLGDPAYYARFGFRAEPGLTLPGVPPEYFMALALAGTVPNGSVAYSEAFDATKPPAGADTSSISQRSEIGGIQHSKPRVH